MLNNVGRWWRSIGHNGHVRVGLMLLGWSLIMSAPVIAVLPGPGGTVAFALGMGLILRNSAWARRRYVRFKRRWPRHGAWADWGLRRASAKRRAAIAKARARAEPAD